VAHRRTRDRRDDRPDGRLGADQRDENARLTAADRELRLAELETIYRSAPIGLAVLDRRLRYLRINERLAEINGVTVADHLGRAVREVVPELADALELLAARVFETGEAVTDYELAGTTASQPGVLRVWREQWLPVTDAAGAVTGILVLVEEVTERRLAETALQQREREYAAMFESSTVGMAQADPTIARFTRVNQALAEMTGYSVEELCRMSWVDLTHPDDRRLDAEALAPVLEGTADRWTSEKRYLRKDRSVIWVNVAGTLIRGPESQPPRTIAIIKDITDRKRAEEAA
jgi:PAS domain S-box-containing protein